MRHLLFFGMFLVQISCGYSQDFSADYYVQSGKSKIQERNISGAISDFSNAIKLDPKNELAYVNRALCRMSLGQWQMAIPDCDKAIEINSKQAVAYFVRGCAKANSRNNGCSDLKKAVELGYSQAQVAIERYCK